MDLIASLVGTAVALVLGHVIVRIVGRRDLRRLQQESDAFVARLAAHDAAELDFLLNASTKEIEEHLARRDEENRRREEQFGVHSWRVYP